MIVRPLSACSCGFTDTILAVVAAVEAVWAVSVRRRIRDGQIGVGADRLHPLAVARSVAVAKASAWVGALGFGWWAGVLVHVLLRRGELRVAAADTPGVAAAAVCAVLLVVAAQWLQYSCRSPQDPTADAAGVPE